jgi:hypothetical protein
MRKRHLPQNEITFDGACLVLETTLKEEARQEIVADLSESKNVSDALLRLRDSMRSDVFKLGANRIDLGNMIKTFDRQTRQDGFHVLQDWDGKADKLNEDTIPVDVANHIIRTIGARSIGENERKVLAILLDYYFLYVLALFSLRVWSEGDANDNLDRVTGLLRHLQGPNGSGQKFAENAETIIFIATAHYEPDEKAYERLLEKVRTLNQSHQLNIAFVHAAILASHLRFGFEAQYKRDIVLMRNDNVPDYPWLCFSLATLMRAYSRLHHEGFHGIEREKIVEGILNGLSADARAFIGKPPASLAAYEVEHAQCREFFHRYRQDLFEEFERHRPSAQMYSPMSLNFNFPHNVLKGIVVNALVGRETSNLTLNDLLTGIPRGERGELKQKFAETLVGLARTSPDTIRGRPVSILLYDPYLGIRNFAKTISIVKGYTSDRSTGTTVPSQEDEFA